MKMYVSYNDLNAWFNYFIFSGCRILNKLTPEKFDKLGLELLNVGIDSELILKGIILLVSEMILNELCTT